MDQIVLNHVTKQFTTKTLGTVTAVNDFNLTIKEGECFSGSGVAEKRHVRHGGRGAGGE